ncbi:unnamed protein product [Rhizoctonia solani]|uniref:Uncharacterized protein n=1 Tax=Rhizoctonia solani TaxID=456999 RepID=A0A8H2X4D0_9AGAM|nr:unnamed protein product [Rhizoctonia solani]
MTTRPSGKSNASGMTRGSGISSTCHPAAIPASVITNLEHWLDAGSRADNLFGGVRSSNAEPPQMRISGSKSFRKRRKFALAIGSPVIHHRILVSGYKNLTIRKCECDGEKIRIQCVDQKVKANNPFISDGLGREELHSRIISRRVVHPSAFGRASNNTDRAIVQS